MCRFLVLPCTPNDHTHGRNDLEALIADTLMSARAGMGVKVAQVAFLASV